MALPEGRSKESKEATRLWSAPRLAGVTLLEAHYRSHTFRPHSQDVFTICGVEAGVCALRVGGERRRIEEGMFTLIGPREVHSGTSASESLSYLDLSVAEALYGLDPNGGVNGFRFQGRDPDVDVPSSLTPEQAVEAAYVLGASRLVPIHYGLAAPFYEEEAGIEERLRSASAKRDLALDLLAPGDSLTPRA